MFPSLGIGLEAAGYPNVLGHLGHVLGGENGIFLTTWLWKLFMLLFITSRDQYQKTFLAIVRYLHQIFDDAVNEF